MPLKKGSSLYERRGDLKLISLLVLLLGLLFAFLIHHSVPDAPVEVLGYENPDGASYPLLPDDSKKYQRDMEVYGGQANLLMDQLRRWLMGPWRGKSLAYLVGLSSAAVAGGIYWAAQNLEDRLPGPEDEDQPKSDQGSDKL